MNKIFLHGGRSSDDSPLNYQYRTNLVNQVEAGTSFLLCYFAREEAVWEECFDKDRQNFAEWSSDVDFQLAEKSNFMKQVSQSSVILFSGGDSFMLIDCLNEFQSIKDELRGKTVAGVSAGACALSKHFYSNDEQRLADGIGFVNAKVYCHYKKELDGNVNKLKEYGESMPIVTLPEHESVLICE